MDFTAKEVNIVADAVEPVKMEVLINGKYVSEEQAGKDVLFDGEIAYVLVDKPQLYNIVDGEYDNYRLDLKINSKDFSFNSFTFG